MRFPHENNAILHIFFHGVPLFGLGLILGVFLGLPGDLPGARWDPSGFQLGHLAASWVSWVASWQPWGALWDQFGLQLGDFVPSWKPCDKSGHPLGHFVSLGFRFGFLCLSCL